MKYCVERHGNVDLEFNGQVLASDTSQEPGKPRWTEVVIYLTDSDKWVTEIRGCSTVEGENTRRKVTVCERPEEVLESFRQWSVSRNEWYYTNISLDVLEDAAEADPRLHTVVRELV